MCASTAQCNNNNNSKTVFMELSSWLSHLPSRLMNVEWCQAAANPRVSQTTYAVSLPVQAAKVYTHHCHHAVSDWQLSC